MTKSRLDLVLVAREFYESREQAQRAIMAGDVRVAGQLVEKPAALIDPDAPIAIREKPRFVSRGGVKLEGALEHFAIDVNDLVAVDIGASTGGFTDCLLQRGARKIYAIDVGQGQLAWKIRRDPRVVVMEKTNARTIPAGLIDTAADLCVIDVSFISLTLILPTAFQLLTRDGTLLALIKPQFELKRTEVGRGGIVRDAELHAQAQCKIANFVAQFGHEVSGIVPSVITGTDGNQEFFLCARKLSA